MYYAYMQLHIHICLLLCFLCRVPPIAHTKKAFENWHVAFHGTASKNVEKILETGFLVLPGQFNG